LGYPLLSYSAFAAVTFSNLVTLTFDLLILDNGCASRVTSTELEDLTPVLESWVTSLPQATVRAESCELWI